MSSSYMVSPADLRDRAAANYRSAVGEVPEVLEMVADMCQAPMAALKVADRAAAHFAATWGISTPVDVPKSRSLCDMVSASHDAMVVDDASHDPRVADHPLVAGSAHVSFIAAAPLHHDGHIVGALCVFDNGRRTIDAATTRRYLQRIARRVDSETGLRHLLARSPLDLAESDDLVATVSHEFRTPLSAIKGYVEVLAETPGAIAPEYARQAAAISRNATRLGRTVDTLLRAVDMQRHEPVGHRRSVELTSAALAAIAGCGPAAARILFEGPSRPVHVHVDDDLLQLAIGHLLSNALAFGGADQPVSMTITDRMRPVLEIQDRGPGLDDSELVRLGTPFFRGTHARDHEMPGIGLGLAVTRGILRAQGADLTFASPSGSGLTARITFS